MTEKISTLERQTPNAKRQTPNAKRQTPIIARIKAWAKKQPLIYYPVRYVKQTSTLIKNFTLWQIYKHTVKFNHNGLNITEQRPRKIIASLTSYPARISVVPYVIASLLNQTVKPDKIILWLAEAQFPDKKLPSAFDELKACGVEVKFCPEDLGPHKKYFYAMQEYPEDIVITFDDDFLYSRYIIETLYKSYLEHPDCVTGRDFHRITFNEDGSIKGFFDWEHAPRNLKGHESYQYSLVGIRSILYPPHSLHHEAFNIEAIMKLCPKADDMWLKFMEVMNGVKAVPASNRCGGMGSSIPGTQGTALAHFNDAGGGNDAQIKAIIEHYSDWHDKNGKTLLEVIREG